MYNRKSSVWDVVGEVVTPILLFVWAITTVVVGLAGPFGTYEALSLVSRLAYWAGVIGVSMVLAIGFRVFWNAIVKNDPVWLEDLLVIGSLSLVFGPFVALFNNAIWPNGEGAITWVFVSAITFLIGLGSVGVRRLMQKESARVEKPKDRLFLRFEATAGARLKRISSDNHHIRVITDDDTEHRILMRLRDAVAEVDVEPGLCVHRSHWVAEDCIEEVIESEGREVLQLNCGAIVPIGPKYRPALVELGLIAA